MFERLAYALRRERHQGARDDSAALRIAVSLPCEALVHGAAGSIRQVWIVGERL